MMNKEINNIIDRAISESIYKENLRKKVRNIVSEEVYRNFGENKNKIKEIRNQYLTDLIMESIINEKHNKNSKKEKKSNDKKNKIKDKDFKNRKESEKNQNKKEAKNFKKQVTDILNQSKINMAAIAKKIYPDLDPDSARSKFCKKFSKNTSDPRKATDQEAAEAYEIVKNFDQSK